MLTKRPNLDELPLPDPVKRNWYWLTFQFVLRLVFAVMLRFRAEDSNTYHPPAAGCC